MTSRSCPVLHDQGVLPGGPRLPVVVQTWLLRTATTGFLHWCRARYGDTFTVRDAIGGRQVFLADPDDIRAVFAGSAAVLRARDANCVLGPVLGRISTARSYP